MRIHIAHSTVYRYDPPATGAIQMLRLTPRNYEGQYVVNWAIAVAPEARLAAHEDAFGNITHVFTAGGPLAELRIEVNGQVETQNTNGIVRGTVERFPPRLFLRDTSLTQANAAIRDFAQQARVASGGETLAELHTLSKRLHDRLVDATSSADAAEGFAGYRRAPIDWTHIFIAAAHSLNIPARFVAGYFRGVEDGAEQQIGHAWAEAFVPDLGWVGFDPTHGNCPTDAHVRVAIGLDSLGTVPLRGSRYGAGPETREIAIKVGQ